MPCRRRPDKHSCPCGPRLRPRRVPQPRPLYWTHQTLARLLEPTAQQAPLQPAQGWPGSQLQALLAWLLAQQRQQPVQVALPQERRALQPELMV